MTEPIVPLDAAPTPTPDRTLDVVHRGATSAVADGWVAGGTFFGAIMAGTLLGWLVDRWLGTDPWLLVVGVVAGSYTGFHRMRQIGIRPTGKQPVDVS